MHIAHTGDGLDVYLRLPMPYLVANLTGAVRSDNTPEPAPYTTNAMVEGELMHYVDYDALVDDATGLGQLAADGHHVVVEDTELVAVVRAVRVHTGDDQPPFSTLEEAKAALSGIQTELSNPAPFVGDSVVDVLLEYTSDANVNRYTISSSLNPELEGQEETANLIVDYGLAEPQIYRIRGLLEDPVAVSHAILSAAVTFVIEGFRHIIEGYDHVLFVICLVLSATALVSLAWRVTGFTLGHSITLALGFFGFTPSAVWFVPLIETAIALSIVAAAIYALGVHKDNQHNSSGFLITFLIGILHGLGFSFVLQEILGVTSPNIWISLLSFNIGVEIGQLLIVLLLWPLLYVINKRKPALYSSIKWIIAMPCLGIAAYWSGQRFLSFLALV